MRVRIGGEKFSFNKLPETIKEKIRHKLASKDPVMAAGLRGELPGILIDGKMVTRDNIKDFVVKPNPLDINKDGNVDKEDASLAGKVLADAKKKKVKKK